VENYRDFDLRVEVLEVLGPLAVELAGLSAPALARDTEGSMVECPGWALAQGEVRSAVTAVDVAWAAIMKMVSDGGALSSAARAHAKSLAAAGSFEVSPDALAAGFWAQALADRVGPVSADLAAVLLKARAPGGYQAASAETLDAALRPLDRAAAALARKMPKVHERQRFASEWAAQESQRELERSARALERLGLS
jgi:hypothetical protein